MGRWAPQEVLPSPSPGAVIPCNDTGWGLAVQNTALENTDVVDRELQRVQQHGQQPLCWASRLREGTCPPLLTVFKSPAEALCPVLGFPVQKGIDLHKQTQWRDTNTKLVIKGWSTGCMREEKAKEEPSSMCAGKAELLFREVPDGKRAASRLKSAQEILS